MFVLAGDGLWDEGTRLITRNGNSAGYYFRYPVALYGDKSLVEDRFSG